MAKVSSEGDLVHIDVRSVPEFEAGHAPNAYNIPLMHMGAGGMVPNPEFAAEVQAHFKRTRRSWCRARRAGARLAPRPCWKASATPACSTRSAAGAAATATAAGSPAAGRRRRRRCPVATTRRSSASG
ncbi:rhodanese-like domain-containing protein [Nannocystis pusilla]|uniref:rhodanese-like domain-containing protein n=1 Tax=Nannocystis pusilla TaxID=889268 RepID=UPI003B83178A